MRLRHSSSTRRTTRRLLPAALTALAMAAVTLVGAGSASAAPVTAVTLTADTYVSDTPSAEWTVGFTPASQLDPGNAVFVEFDGFDLTGPITVDLLTGFAGTCGAAVDSVVTTYVVVTLPAGCSLAAATPATLTITGIESDFNQYTTGTLGAFGVLTYVDATFATPIDTRGTPSIPGGLHITAQTTYATTTSSNGATTSGMAPAPTTNTIADTTVTVAGNTGGLTLTGYTFSGWCTTNAAPDPTACTGTEYPPGATFSIAANTTLYSVWDLVPSAADGTGTLTLPPTTVNAGSSGHTLVFTYTAAAGGTNGGAVHVAVPAGWSTPSAAAGPGCTRTSAGTLAFAGQTIQVTGVTLPTAGTLTITYGATTGGACTAGSGATAQSTAGTATFATTQKSTLAGTLTALAASPSATVALPSCLPGFYLVVATCVPASIGHFVSDAGAIMQTPCPAGYFAAVLGSTNCTPASPGHFVPTTGSGSETACEPGTFAATTSSTSCTPAIAGHFVATAGSNSQTACEPGTFAATTSSTSCTPASAGSFVATVGSSSQTACSAGYFSSAARATACTSAPAGSFAGPTGATSATACAVNTFSAEAGASACTPCPASTSTAGATGATSCTAVPVATPTGVAGTLELVWSAGDAATLRLAGSWDRTRISRWQLRAETFGVSASCPGSKQGSVVEVIDRGTTGTSLPSSFTVAPRKGACNRYTLSVTPTAGADVDVSSAWQQEAMARTAVTTTIKLSRDLATFDGSARTEFLTSIASALGISTSRLTFLGVTAGGAARAAGGPAPRHLFKVASKPVRGGKLRVVVNLTKVGRAYLVANPALQGKRVRVVADFVVRVKGASTPITTTRTFSMRMPKLGRKA